MPIWHQSPKLTPRYFLETPRLFGYPQNPKTWDFNHFFICVLFVYNQKKCRILQKK